MDSTENDTRSGFGYGCQCDDGYEGTGTYCTDINECRELHDIQCPLFFKLIPYISVHRMFTHVLKLKTVKIL